MYVEVTANRDKFVNALSERGIVSTQDGGAVVVEDATTRDLDAIRDALVASDAPLHRLAPRRRTLLDIFRTDARGSSVVNRSAANI